MLVFVGNEKQEKIHWSPGAGGGEISHNKKVRGAYWKFWKEPLRATKILTCVCDFHPYEAQIPK